VLESNRELWQEGRQPAGHSQPLEGSMEQVFLAHLATIKKAAAHACRRYGLGREDTEDFTQHVLAKIVADDYAVLRKHRGSSKLSTYLVVVVQRALLDFMNRRWGKWRPTEDAKRLGTLAIRLETLLVRDQLGFREACQILWTNEGVKESEAALDELAGKLPRRTPRRPETSLETGGSSGGAGGPGRSSGRAIDPRQLAGAQSADERVMSEERARQRERVHQALMAALRTLPAEDQLLLRLKGEKLTIAQIARTLCLDQKALYKRLDKIKKTVRAAMERAGISARDIGEILAHADD
jgi:RNA polymerase sigma factor (sigma-70 family)